MNKLSIAILVVASNVLVSAVTAALVSLSVASFSDNSEFSQRSIVDQRVAPDIDHPEKFDQVQHDSIHREHQHERAETLRQHLAEAQRQREAAEQRAREEAGAAMQRQLAGEADAAANAQHPPQEVFRFANIVRREVEQAWAIPPGASHSMSATIQVRLGPSGELIETSVATSSGDTAFDRSAMQAVEHAAPFGELRELPADQQRNLRQFNLRFSPGDVR